MDIKDLKHCPKCDVVLYKPLPNISHLLPLGLTDWRNVFYCPVCKRNVEEEA